MSIIMRVALVKFINVLTKQLSGAQKARPTVCIKLFLESFCLSHCYFNVPRSYLNGLTLNLFISYKNNFFS